MSQRDDLRNFITENVELDELIGYIPGRIVGKHAARRELDGKKKMNADTASGSVRRGAATILTPYGHSGYQRAKAKEYAKSFRKEGRYSDESKKKREERNKKKADSKKKKSLKEKASNVVIPYASYSLGHNVGKKKAKEELKDKKTTGKQGVVRKVAGGVGTVLNPWAASGYNAARVKEYQKEKGKEKGKK